MVLLKSFYVILAFHCTQTFRANNFEVTFERFVCLPGKEETLVEFLDWKFSRDHLESKIGGKLNYHVDLDETILVSFGWEYNTPGKQAGKHPFKIKNSTMCDFYNKIYYKYLEKSFRGHSNFPTVAAQGSCHIPKGNYWVDNATMDFNFIPSVTPRGLWKGELSTFRNNKPVGGLILYLRLK